MLAKLVKAKSALAKFRGPGTMRAADWKAIIGFSVPRHSASDSVSKYQTIPLIQDKLANIEEETKKTGMCL